MSSLIAFFPNILLGLMLVLTLVLLPLFTDDQHVQADDHQRTDKLPVVK